MGVLHHQSNLVEREKLFMWRENREIAKKKFLRVRPINNNVRVKFSNLASNNESIAVRDQASFTQSVSARAAVDSAAQTQVPLDDGPRALISMSRHGAF
jgi:hypothetical protein